MQTDLNTNKNHEHVFGVACVNFNAGTSLSLINQNPSASRSQLLRPYRMVLEESAKALDIRPVVTGFENTPGERVNVTLLFEYFPAVAGRGGRQMSCPNEPLRNAESDRWRDSHCARSNTTH